MKDQKNMYQRKTRHEKSRRIIYEISYKMGVLNVQRFKLVVVGSYWVYYFVITYSNKIIYNLIILFVIFLLF